MVYLPFALVSASGCSSNYGKAEEATKQMLSAMDELSAALESVKDKETAKAAAPKIEAASQRMIDAKKKLEPLKGSKAEEEKLAKEYKGKMEEAAKRLQSGDYSSMVKSDSEPTFLKAVKTLEGMK